MKTHTLAALVLAAPLVLVGAGESIGAGDSSSSSSGSGNSKYEQYYKKGEAARKKNNYVDAVNYYKQALKAKPKDADALNNLGFSLRSIGKQYMMEAARAYDDALSADAEHEGALEYQGELYLWMGELSKANANLQKLKRLSSPEAEELQRELDSILAQAKKLQ